MPDHSKRQISYSLFGILFLFLLSAKGAVVMGRGCTNAAWVLFSQHLNGSALVVNSRGYFDLGVVLNPRDPSAHRGIGLQQFRLFQYSAAEISLTMSLVLDPKNVITRFWVGRAYEQQGAIEQAVSMWRSSGAEAIYFVRQAESKRVMGNLDEALYLFSLAARIDPGSSSAHYGIARVYQQQGFSDKALSEYRAAIAINSKWDGILQATQAHYLVGGILADHHRDAEAMDELTQALRLIGNACLSTHEACILEANIHSALGALYQRQSQWEKARSEYRQAIQLDPEQRYLYVQLGKSAYYATRDLATAMQQFQVAIEKNPTDTEVWIGIADFYRQAGLHHEALDCLDRAPEVIKANLRFKFLQGKMYYEFGRYQDAIDMLQVVLKASHGTEVHDIYNLLGSAYFNLGNYDEAERSLQIALAANTPSNASIHALLGAIYFRTGRLDKAEQESRIAIGIAPAFAWAYVTLGDVFWEKGQTELAKDYYRQAVRFGSEQIPSDELGRLMLRTGN